MTYRQSTYSRRLTLAILLSVAIIIQATAQDYQKTDLGVRSTVNAIDIEIQFYAPSIIRVLKSPQAKPFNKESLSVIKTPEKVGFSVKQAGDIVQVQTKDLNVKLNIKNGQIVFHDAKGTELLSEKERSTAFTPFDDAGNATYNVSQSFVLEKDEAIYGLGQLQNGKMVQRNQQVKMIQGNTNDYVPFMHSAKGYGLFWDNYSPTTFTDNQDETSFSSEVGDCVDYYFMYGQNADGVIAKMRDLTGTAPMFPLWTFGYWQSKERYKSQDETVGVVKKYRELGVPIDGIIQDWQYWGNNYLWNAMEFLNPEFYNPKKMVDDVHNLNARIIISIWSSFGPQTKPYRELEKIGALFTIKTWPESGSEKWPPIMDYPSGVRVYDAYNPAARDIYWKYLKNGLLSVGMDGWWMDSTEPDHFRPEASDFDTKTYLGSFRKVRNAYPLMTVGGVYQHQRAETSDKRVFILTRSAFAGQQRYGANTWSGDVVASWDALRKQISAGLNFSLCGIPYWNSDIGGFFLWNFKLKLEDPEYRELYARWLQFGTFTPLMRSHGEGAPREIYQFGKKGDDVYDAIEKFIHLRYSLLPYIYSSSWDVTANHSSMMRALVMDFPKDREALNINDQYMFGKSLLVSPVTNSMYVKPVINGNDTTYVDDFSVGKIKTTYLPNNTTWYDFWTGERFTGGKKVSKETPINVIPLYVKAGSIIPIGPAVQYAEERKWDDLEIRIYPGASGSFVLYEDEFDNYNYETGMYSTITFTWDDARQTLVISDRKGSFPGMLNNRAFQLIIVNTDKGGQEYQPSSPDKVVTYTGKRIQVKL
jgi:alpha-D-xyloside xylohydrolase